MGLSDESFNTTFHTLSQEFKTEVSFYNNFT